MSKRLTLAEQLAEIAEPAPVELDPEDGYAGYSAERNSDKRDLEAARSEYVDVGTSKLRKKGEAVYDKKYEGKKMSRKDLEGSDNDDDESGEEGEEEDEDEEMGDFEDLEGDDDDESGEDDEESGSEEEEEEEPAPKPKKSIKKDRASTTTEQDEKAMMSQLKLAASADVEKGRDVKKQLVRPASFSCALGQDAKSGVDSQAFSDNILEARIKIQKAATSINLLPQPPLSKIYFAQVEDELSETLKEVEELNEELFSLRKVCFFLPHFQLWNIQKSLTSSHLHQELLSKEPTIELPSSLGASRKRKRGTPSEYLAATLTDLSTLETALTPFLRLTIQKWSDKVLAASGLLLTSSKKFKSSATANLNSLAQIDHSLSAGEKERLLKRTRVNRNLNGEVVGKEGERLEGEKKEVDEEVFDDADFYGQMLRDLVESRMLDLGELGVYSFPFLRLLFSSFGWDSRAGR
ncbi:protein AATF/BFR2, partial [Phenoliferia sp. Uapishka_3]